MDANIEKSPKCESAAKKFSKPKVKKPPGLWSRLFFCWMFPIFYNGNRRDLEEEDLVPTKHSHDSKIVGDKLERSWLREVRAAKVDGREANFTKVIFTTFFWSYLPGGLMQLTAVILRTISPMLFGKLLQYWSVKESISRETAMYYGIGMILNNFGAVYMNHHGQLYCQQFGMKLRVATSSLMFRKIMRMSNTSLGDTTAGKVVNLLSNDLQRFDLALMFLHYVWIIPIQLLAVMYFGYLQAGMAVFVGILIVVMIALPIQMGLSFLLSRIRLKTAEKTDDRIKVMSEIINGIQVIKMYAWEMPFQHLVGQKREDEVMQTRKATIIRTVSIGFMLFLERTVFFFTVLTFILLGNPMSANVIYPLQQFLSVVQVNVTWILLLVLSHTAELIVSLKRVQNFLSLEDRPDFWEFQEPSNLFHNLSTTSILKADDPVRPISYTQKTNDFGIYDKPVLQKKYGRTLSMEEIAINLYDVSASWVGDSNQMALKNISLQLQKGSLCAIIGAVGSGKSSILQLLLKELNPMSGTISINGKMSYACQEAWLFPSTVRENILFGLPYDAEKYNKVCKVCTLQKDFTQFPFGDQTLVGERGVSLSGGQRARINLARAVYREADIYLLDDPLSAVDANVGRVLFEDCISGYLCKKTRILVTHQIHFLKAADFIVVLNKGRIENMGTFNELISSGKEFAMLLSSLQESKDKDMEGIGLRAVDESKPAMAPVNDNVKLIEFEAQKMKDEERQSGNLRWEVISTYFKSGGSLCLILFTLITIVLNVACGAAVDFWVSYWANQMSNYEKNLAGAKIDTAIDAQVGLLKTGQYLIVHGTLVVLTIIMTHVRVIPFVQLCVSASNKLHSMMFSTMLRGVMRFFDTSSTGRILNRFAKDMGSLDEILPRTLLDVIQIYGVLCSILVLNAIVLYWTIIPSSILLIVFYLIVRLYLKTAQGIKRLEGTTKSPVFAMVSSSLNGISTIRAADAQQRLIDEFDTHQDLHSSAWNGYLTGGTSFGLYLDTVCLFYLTCVIMVYLFIDFGDLIAAGSVGLAVSQSNTLTVQLQHGARMLVEFLAQLTSVERILEYTRIETEPNLFEGEGVIPPTWPNQGKIVFKNVSLKYAPDEKPVLKNLNITVETGWKVGIVGRTGAGKSSLISALFRFAHIDGSISIDGIDTSLVSRQGLRSKISIIPQEPILFSATVRYNLDPFNIYSDDDLWRALEQVDLKSAIQSLDFKVTEGGANFSVGQRQLMCLARAVLRSNKILIMDEATANVDPQTDNLIQKMIRHHFKSCTVLTIAHRLNTIMDSDRVLVMSTGQIVEYDHPYVLLSNSGSHLSSMVRETGEKNAAILLETAKEAYFQNKLKENTTQ